MRDDLLALTDDALISLANRGLLKRSRKLIDRGSGPDVTERDEVVVGVFDDGIKTALPPGVPLAETDCSCPATGMCRHRIMVVLAYQAQGATDDEPETEQPWDPAEFDDDALTELLGARTVSTARRGMSRGLVAEVVRGARPSCRLPATTVRFLVPHELAYARCDCEEQTACQHVAHAVWAFREALGTPGDSVTVALTGRVELEMSAADAGVALADQVLTTGVIHLPETVSQRFEAVKSTLSEARMVWPLGAVEDLEDLVQAYRGRSARYSPEAAARTLMELRARRDASGPSELPATSILGTSVAAETKLDQLRLVSVGARVQAFERTRRCEVFLVDPGSATVLVARRELEAPEGELLGGIDLARVVITGKARLGALATGQVVTQVARRRANRLVVIGSGTARTSVTPQVGDWSLIPEPVRVPDFQAFQAAWEARPPRLLRPRVLAENVHVFRVDGPIQQAWSPSRQTLMAVIPVPNGQILAELPWRGVTAGAVAATSQACAQARWVSGEVRREARGFVLRPLAFSTPGGLVVPDIAGEGEMDAPTGNVGDDGDAIDQAVAAAWRVLVEAAHGGLLQLSSAWSARLKKRAKALSELGMKPTARLLDELATAVRSPQDPQAVCALWCRAMTRLEVAAELAGG